jgi:probable HAF family extracellular repeat protein
MTRSHLATVLCFTISTAALAAPPPPRHYSITTIPLGAFDDMAVYDMNELGHVIGVRTRYKGLASAVRYGFFWSPETGTVDLGQNLPMALNGHDVVVGNTLNGAFRWTAAQGAQTIPGVADVADINNAGQILGRRGGSGHQGVIRNPDGTVRTLPVPPNTADLHLTRLTPAGDATGWLYITDPVTTNGVTLAHVWPSGGGFSNLGDLPGGNVLSFAGRMNFSRTIAGSGSVPDGGVSNGQRAVYWDQNRQIHEIGLLPGMSDSGAEDINNLGEIVGFSSKQPDGVHAHAFLWTGEQGMLDLNQFIDNPGNHWMLTYAEGISDSGLIAADALYDGQAALGVLLVPDGAAAPEPATAVVLLAGWLALRSGRRRHLRG